MTRMLLIPVMIVVLALAGCGQKEAPEGNAGAEGTGPVPGMSEEAAEALEAARDAGESTLKAATDAAGEAGEAVDEMAAAAKAQADKLLVEAKKCIESGKFDEAKAALADLGAMKDQLPEDVAAKLSELEGAYEKAVDAAKSLPDADKPLTGGSD